MLGNFQGLVDRNLGRNLAAVFHFIHCNAENIAVNGRHPLHAPVMGIIREQCVNVFHVAAYAGNEFPGIRKSLFSGIKAGTKLFEFNLQRLRISRSTLKIMRKEKLQGNLSRLSTQSHEVKTR